MKNDMIIGFMKYYEYEFLILETKLKLKSVVYFI